MFKAILVMRAGRVILPAAAFLLVLLAFTSGKALAAPVTGILQVTVTGNGTVTGTGITCPSDCSTRVNWQDSDPLPPVRSLTAAPASGWALDRWEGCGVTGNPLVCDVIMSPGENYVTAAFRDVEAPKVTLGTGAEATRNNAVRVTVNATDNDRVESIAARVDGVQRPMQMSASLAIVNLEGVADGYHDLAFVVRDPAGNQTVSETHRFLLDRVAPVVTQVSGPANGAEVKEGEVTVGFEITDNIGVRSTICRVNGVDYRAGCPAAIAINTTADQEYEVVVTAEDRAGSITSTTVRFRAVRDDGGGNPPPPPPPGGKLDGSVRLATKTVKLHRRIALRVSCNTACEGDIQMKGPKGVTLRGKISLAKAGTRKVVLKPGRAAARKLAKVKPGRKVKLRLRADLRSDGLDGVRVTAKQKVKAR